MIKQSLSRGFLWSIVFMAVLAFALCQAPAAAAQSKWDQVVKAAKKEGKVVVFGPPGTRARRALTEPFQKKFGIKVQYTGGFGSEFSEKIMVERRAGIYSFDVHLGGTTTMVTVFERAGILESLEPMFILPEVKDPKNWVLGHLWVDNTTKTIYLATLQLNASVGINTSQVNPKKLTSFNDLLDPKWKGKIAFFDPRRPGPGLASWTFLGRTLGEEYLKNLAAQKLTIFPRSREMAEAIVRGRFPIGIGVLAENIAPLKNEGLPITLLKASHMKEGTYVSPGPGAVVVFKKPPNPNAAIVYLNWILSKEGQIIFSTGIGYPHRRADTPPVKTLGRQPIQPLIASGEPLPMCNGCTLESIREGLKYRALARRLLR